MSGYTYGPVPSRRLGRSLGVDLVPAKTCDFNCIYCQLGPGERTTLARREYVPVEEVVEEVRARLAECARPDYVTLAGSGEPTLHASFGRVAAGIREITEVPVALLTNGSLFHLPDVRGGCGGLDLVLPSLDAGDEETFRRVNRPHPDLTLALLVEGLVRLREEFRGQMWLEVLIVEGLNSGDEQIRRIKQRIDRIRPHRVQINTAVRPPAEPDVRTPPAARLEEIRAMLGPRAEIIAPPGRARMDAAGRARRQQVLDLLRRRPCTPQDVAAGLGIAPNEAVKYLRALLDEGQIRRRQRLYETYYEAAG